MSQRTKEHIIPKWLIQLIGEKSREISLGFNYKRLSDEGAPLINMFSFDKFVSPACARCNNEIGGSLEGQVKPIIKNILCDKPIRKSELKIFLDWLDKTRINIWLAMNQINNNVMGVEPRFYSLDRLGKKDRLLAVYKVNCDLGVTMMGSNSPVFCLFPSIMAFGIKNYIFYNVSYDSFVGKLMGGPFYKNQFVTKHKDYIFTNYHDKAEPNSNPLKDINIISTPTIILNNIFYNSNKKYKINDSLKNVTLSETLDKKIVDNLFVQKNNEFILLDDEETYLLCPNEVQDINHDFLTRITYKILINQKDIYSQEMLNATFYSQEIENEVKNYVDCITIFQNIYIKLLGKISSHFLLIILYSLYAF